VAGSSGEGMGLRPDMRRVDHPLEVLTPARELGHPSNAQSSRVLSVRISCSVDQRRASGQCAGIRVRRSASCRVSAIVPYRPISRDKPCERSLPIAGTAAVVPQPSTVCFSGRTYAQLARIVWELCAVAGR